MQTQQMTADSLEAKQLLKVLIALKKGDFSVRLPVEWTGTSGKIADTLNEIIELNEKLVKELARVSRVVGREGKLTQRAALGTVDGSWATLVEAVNSLIDDLVRPTSEIARVIGVVANGDLSQTIALEVDGRPLEGQFLRTAKTVNSMLNQLSSFASEVTRVAREVGTEGKLGGQANVKGVAGTWKDLTDSVNRMASNLTGQVRNIAEVTTAVAKGDLSKKITADVRGEILELKDTINNMVDQLRSFAAEVTRVAREVGTEGKLGGQADVKGVAGTWKDLTDNVNQLAANLTTQVRAIAEVATAVTKGDLTRFIQVEARGEVAILKDTINEMIRNLRDTTRKNSEQDWLKTNLARFTSMLSGQKDLLTVARLILSELAPLVSVQYGTFYLMEDSAEDEPRLRLLASYAYRARKNLGSQFRLGEGLVGQCALEKHRVLLTNVPGDYIQISSGLGEAPPLNILVLPVLFEGQVKAVIELASFQRFSATHEAFFDQLMGSIGIVLNTIQASMRTEELLKQSQSLAQELQNRQGELQQINAELEKRARLLAEQKAEVERKNHEVEQAKQELEDKAAQLALTSKYKSEFLANMSHELRTPLNSLLILAYQLSQNPEGNLTQRQVEFAKTIYASGSDLLALIDDILDLAKIESGTMTVEIGEVLLTDVRGRVEQAFRPVAEAKGLDFTIELDSNLPQSISTDEKRLQQVLRNLLSNAFKFTEQGQVALRIASAAREWNPDPDGLNRAKTVVAFSVCDTGIGIPADQQKLIFEAFQQVDRTASRKYGGTGLGLSICREMARLLGGEICIESAPGEGSTFTFYLPHPPTMSWTLERGSERDQGNGLVQHALTSTSQIQPVDGGTPDPGLPHLSKSHLPQADVVLAGKKVLIVDDDIRSIFALTSTLERYNVEVLSAENGKEGIEVLQQTPGVDIVLVDIMMPGMDGYDVMRAIRKLDKYKKLPIIAVTAKAMKGDREKCIEAGASDYISKPVDTEQLLSRLCMAVSGGGGRAARASTLSS